MPQPVPAKTAPKSEVKETKKEEERVEQAAIPEEPHEDDSEDEDFAPWRWNTLSSALFLSVF